MGMVRVGMFVAMIDPDESPAILAQGVYEVLFNVVFGFGLAFVALYGFAAVRLLAKKDI